MTLLVLSSGFSYSRPLWSTYTWFTRGEVLSVEYRHAGYGFVFTGLCLKVRLNSMKSTSTTFLLRNIFSKVSVELNIALYGVCRLSFKSLGYARKKLVYRSSKLYYLRNRPNNESWVK